MKTVTQRSCSVYAVLLFAYPSDFRHHVSGEMKETFACQLRGAWERDGLDGAWAVWRLALWELFSVAIPLQMQNSIVIAAGLSVMVSSASALLFFRSIAPHCSK